MGWVCGMFSRIKNVVFPFLLFLQFSTLKPLKLVSIKFVSRLYDFFSCHMQHCIVCILVLFFYKIYVRVRIFCNFSKNIQ